MLSQLRKMNRSEWVFAGFLCLFLLLFVVVEINNKRFETNDLKVYYEATKDFAAGNNPYLHPYGLGSGYFKYTPFTLYLFIPQTGISYFYVQLIHVSFVLLSLIIVMISMRRIVSDFSSLQFKSSWLYLVLAVFVIHITRELHLGNVNILLLLLFLLGVFSYLNKNDLTTAIWWSLMLVLKPILLPIFIPLIFLKKWRIILFSMLFGILFVLITILHHGWNFAFELWSSWLEALSKHGGQLVTMNSMGKMGEEYFGIEPRWVLPVFTIVVLVGLMLIDFLRNASSNKQLLTWHFVFLAIVPNVFVTDTEHFLFSIPLVFLLLNELRETKKWFYWLVFGLGMLFFSFNSTDLLGKDLARIVFDSGCLGIGNLLFISLYLYLHFQSTKKSAAIVNS